jgi:sporulation integral membrane protein YlbJ
MVISELVIASGASSVIGRLLRAPMKAIFKLSGNCISAVVLGWICGFPIGAKTAVALYDSGDISKDELERLLAFSNTPSSAFVISVVGTSLFGSRSFGITLYVFALLSAFICGLLQRPHIAPDTSDHLLSSDKKVSKIGIDKISCAISSSAESMLRVCAFVVFFTAFTGTLSNLCIFLGQPATALLFGLFEITGGAAQSSVIDSIYLGTVISALAVGWSGLSVHCQIIGICAGREISFKRYFTSKLLQGILCATFTLISLILFPNAFEFSPSSYVSSFLYASPSPIEIVLSIVFLISIFVFKKRKIRS